MDPRHNNIDQSSCDELRALIASKNISVDVYHQILSELILTGKSAQYQDIASNITACLSEYLENGALTDKAKEVLYQELNRSWKFVNKSKRLKANEYSSIVEILAWGYELTLKGMDGEVVCSNLEKFKIDHLVTFWEAVKFSQIESSLQISGFGSQSVLQWNISCSGMMESNLRSFFFGGPDYLSTVTVEMWRLFWEAINRSKIEDLSLSFVEIPKRKLHALWDVMCDGIKISKLKRLNLSRMSLNKLTREQWLKLYGALADINLESLDLTCNHLYGFATIEQFHHLNHNQLHSFDVICDIIKLPSLRHLRLLEDEFEKLTVYYGWNLLGQAINNSCLESLEISVSSGGVQGFDIQDDWLIFINSLMGSQIKVLHIEHGSSDELNHGTVFASLCEMIKASQLQSISVRHIFKSLACSIEEWTMLGEALKTRGIKTLDFGSIDTTTEYNLTGLFTAVRIADIERLNIQNASLAKVPAEFWPKLSNLFKDSKITTLDIRNEYSISQDEATWNGFCNMILSSNIRTLYMRFADCNELTHDQMKLFCHMIRNSRLENFMCNFNYDLCNMPKSNFDMLFDAINRSNITCLSYKPDNLPGMKTDRYEIIIDTLRIVANRAKSRGKLLGLVAATLFNRFNAELTASAITYKDGQQSLEHPLSSSERDILSRYFRNGNQLLPSIN